MSKKCNIFGLGILAVAVAASPVRAQISRLPEAIQKKLAQINSVYRSANEKYGAETIELFTRLLATRPKAGITVIAEQAYGRNPKQKLDVYQPQESGNLPIIIFVHGGAMTGGNKNQTKEVLANVLYYFARRGFLGINANYRLAPKYVYPAAVQDIGSVVAWTKENAKRFGGDRSASI